MFEVLDYTPECLPADKPRYLMGVGRPSDIVGSVLRGIDTFKISLFCGAFLLLPLLHAR